MKQLKLILSMVLATFLLCSCGKAVEVEDLTGTWVTTGQSSRKSVISLLKKIDFYTEELAAVDLDSLEYVKYAEFTEDKQYTFYYDVEATKVCVKTFFEGVMDSLFDKRTTLNSVYETTFDNMTREEFNQFYATMYGFADYDTMLNTFSERALDCTALAEFTETGTFKVHGPTIVCVITPEETEDKTQDNQKKQDDKNDEKEVEEEGDALGVMREGEYLILTFADATEKYTKVE